MMDICRTKSITMAEHKHKSLFSISAEMNIHSFNQHLSETQPDSYVPFISHMKEQSLFKAEETPSNSIQDSLERINANLQRLIEEGQESLTHTEDQTYTQKPIPRTNHSLSQHPTRHAVHKRPLPNLSKARSIHSSSSRSIRKKAYLPVALHVVSLCILRLLSSRSLNRLRFFFSLFALLPLCRKSTCPVIDPIDQFIIRFV